MTNTFNTAETRLLKASVQADFNKGKSLHCLLSSQVNRLGIEKLRGRKSKPYISIDGKVCEKIWKGRKAQGAVESKESVRIFVSGLWEHGIAPFIKIDSEGVASADMDAIKADTAKWESGEKSVWKQRRKRTVNRVTLSPPEAYVKWFKGLDAPNAVKYLKSALGKEIGSFHS